MTKAPAASRTAVLGASPKEDRYSFKALRMLREHGYQPIPVHPAGHVVDGIQAVRSLDDIDGPVDTVSVYVSSKISDGEFERIVRLKPRRVIFNPGAENPGLARRLQAAGLEVVQACTLVLLRTEQY
ncbi:MAG: CoA-binding protein [Candidatus Zixiibacteriota bacterium]|nr:MAG: CoA-binding protein [candidate division Zixibacteria bacterium]